MTTRYKPIGQFRSDFVGYHVFQTSGARIDESALNAVLHIDEQHHIPLSIVSIDYRLLPSESRLWAVAFPLIEGDANLQLDIMLASDNAVLANERINGDVLKWRSRINRRIKRDTAKLVDGLSSYPAARIPSISVTGVYPYDKETCIIRTKATLQYRAEEPVKDSWQTWLFVDGSRQKEGCLTLKTVLAEEDDVRVWHWTNSFRVNRSATNVIVAMVPCVGGQPGCSVGLIPQERDALMNSFFQLSEDAKLNSWYPEWFERHRATKEDLQLQSCHAFERNPLISIITPLFETPLAFLQDAVESVMRQSYANWELVLVDTGTLPDQVRDYLASLTDQRIRIFAIGENLGIAGNTNIGIRIASGEYVAFMDQDDALEPDALFHYAKAINEHPGADLLYCDEDNFTSLDFPSFEPLLKPDYNPDLLYSHNYIVHMLMVSRWALDQVGLSPDDSSGAQDYDLSLRISEVARSIVHIPRVLYHWRQHERSSNAGNVSAKPYAQEAGRLSIARHFERRGIEAEVDNADDIFVYLPKFKPSNDHLVSVVIPNASSVEALADCLSALQSHAGSVPYEVVAVASEAASSDLSPLWRECHARSCQRLCILTASDNTALSSAVNRAAETAAGDYLLILDCHCAPTTSNFIDTMLGYFSRDEVGVVGPLVLQQDGLIEQAGLAVMQSGKLAGLNRSHSLIMNRGYLGCSSCSFNCSAVSAHCQLVSSRLFSELGGYSSEISGGLAAVDFCWKALEQGKFVTYVPHASIELRGTVIFDRDSVSVDPEWQTQKDMAIMHLRWPRYFAEGDPCINPNCDKDSPYFKLGR